MPVEIQRIDHANSRLLDNVALDVFDFEVKPPYLAAFLDDPRHVLLVAIDNTLVVGMASAFEYFHPDKPAQLFINEVGVAASHRRQGIGRRLTSAMLDEAQRRGCGYAWLGTGSDNTSGQHCFGSVPGAGEPEPFLL